jgi:pimeloyl-ACP methyl ester carboxylesterase
MKEAKDGFIAGPLGRIHYLELGAGAPLVLLHGAGNSAYEFEHVVGPLSRTFRVIRWDMPGHGDSDPLIRIPTIVDYADALAAMISALELRRPHLVGTSVGALIAAAQASSRGADVASLSLVEMPVRSAAAWADMWPLVETMFSTPTQSLEQVKVRFRKLSHGDFKRWNVDRNKAGGKTMMAVMGAIRDHMPEFEAVSAPVQLVYGEHGPVGDGINDARAALPAAELVTMSGCGHFPMIDDPDAFADIIGRFALKHENALACGQSG